MSLFSEQLWLIVAAKDDRTARSLTGALRMDGDRAILIDTVAMLEEYVATTALCVVVLSRAGPPPDLLAAASKLRFAAHIPIVTAVDDALPAGPWASTIVFDGDENTTLVEQLYAHAQEAMENDALQAKESDLAPPPKLPLIKSERTARRIRRFRIALIAISILTLLLYATDKPFLLSIIPSSSYHGYQLPPNYPLGVAYSVHVPGRCDKTPTVRWFETYNNSMICRQDGLLMERDNLQYNDLTRFSVNEDKPERYFGTAYSAQATMQFIQSDKTTCMGLDVFEQVDDNYGNVSFFVCGDGHWESDRFSTSGALYKQLGSSMLPQPQTTYTMRVMIQDSTMSMQLNGVKIATLPVPDFVTTLGVALTTTELGNSTFISQVLFSDFSVQPGTPAN